MIKGQIKYYLIPTSVLDETGVGNPDKYIPDSEDFDEDLFMSKAEELGSVYQNNFQAAFNSEEINTSTDLLYIKITYYHG